jgi:hypothetical protein
VVSHGAFEYSASIETTLARRNTVNIAKHMEAIFVVALAFAGSASLVVDNLPEAQAHVAVPVASQIATRGNMPVVIVSAKRMTDAEKRASLQAERKAGSSI